MKNLVVINNFKNLFSIIGLVILLVSCDLSKDLTQGGDVFTDGNSEYYLNKADSATKQKDKINYQLLAAKAMLDENKSSMAGDLLNNLTQLDQEQEKDKNLILANIYANLTKDNQALSLLNNIKLKGLNKSQLDLYYKAYAKSYANNKDYINSVIALNKQYDSINSKNRKLDNTNATWDVLLNMDVNAIDSAKINAQEDDILYGWLDLIRIYKTNISQPQQLKYAIENWKVSNKNHPANIYMPDALKNIASYSATNIQKIALLLPLDGDLAKIGEMIKIGFMDANNNQFEVINYNTNNTSIKEIIDDATDKGVNTIVGPLLKPKVNELLNNDLRGLNVLTLNSASSTNKTLENVCYFGLSPEIEARDAVEFMWSQGVRNPVALMINNDVGMRSSEIFKQYWQDRSSNQIIVKLFSNEDDLGKIVNEISNQTRNEPIDAFYVIGNNKELSLVKGILSANSKTNNVPIFASSRSNSSNNTVSFGIDMSGVSFSDIPLLQNPNASIYQKANQVANNDYTLIRLYAMGYDAFNLVQKTNEMKKISGFSLEGLTGKLKSDNSCTIERNMSWFKYNDGSINLIR